MGEVIINSGSEGPYGLRISPSGTLPIAGMSGGVFYTLLTKDNGTLVTEASSTPGSSYILSSPGSIGIYTPTLGSFVGSVYQLTSPWVISGTANISGVFIGISGVVNPSPGSVYNLSSPGSNPIWMTIPLFDLGSPGYKTASASTSGTNVNVWAPGNGSKVQIHGWEVSAQAVNTVFIQISGTNPNQIPIMRYFLPNSGTAIKTFVHPITPASPGSPIGFGQEAAGSITVTIYGREIV